jgi:hypothetical protein
VPAVAWKLQLQAASAFFDRLGVSMVPWPVAELLRQADVDYALWKFASDIGLDYAVLLDRSQAEHDQQRNLLRDAVVALVAADVAVRDTDLSKLPILDAVRHSPQSTAHLLDRLELAGVAWRYLTFRSLHWRSYADFVSSATSRLLDWTTLADDDIRQVISIGHDYEAAARVEADTARELASLIARLDARPDNLTWVLLSRQLRSDGLALHERLRTASFDEIGSLLQDYADLLALGREAAALTGDDDPWPEETEPPNLEQHLAVLELDALGRMPTEEELKSAYRKMMLRWHPDRHGGSRQAEERFKDVRTAYDALQAALASQSAPAP